MNTPQIAAAIARRAAIMQALAESPEGLRMPQIAALLGVSNHTVKGLMKRTDAVLVGNSHTAVWSHPDHVATAEAARTAASAARAKAQEARRRERQHLVRGYATYREVPSGMPDGPVIRIVPTHLAAPIRTSGVRSVFEVAA
jgi:cytochrome P450